jgi:hypothetical protein
VNNKGLLDEIKEGPVEGNDEGKVVNDELGLIE